MKEVKTDNELFEQADNLLSDKFNRCPGNFSFIIIYGDDRV